MGLTLEDPTTVLHLSSRTPEKSTSCTPGYIVQITVDMCILRFGYIVQITVDMCILCFGYIVQITVDMCILCFGYIVQITVDMYILCFQSKKFTKHQGGF